MVVLCLVYIDLGQGAQNGLPRMVFEKYRSRISPIQKQPILDGLIIYLRVQQFGAIVRVSEVLVCECECKLTWGKWGEGGMGLMHTAYY